MTVPESNKGLVRRFYEEIDKGNIGILDELVAEDYIDHEGFGFFSALHLVITALRIRSRRETAS